MAGLAHAGIGLAAKQIAPRAPLWLLVVGAYGLDIVWGVFALAGVEHYPKPGRVVVSRWSHGLFMSAIWSVAAASVAALVCRNPRASLFTGLLVFSHWVVDFIAKPMRFPFPSDTGLPLLFDESRTVGLGLLSTRLGTYIGEYGTFLAGLAVYFHAIGRMRENGSSPGGRR